MLSPNELIGARFDKSAFGYRVDDVDKYVAKVGEVVAQLMEENRELEDKLEILATKLEEYRNDEESLRAALLGAQKLGDSVIRDSKSKAEVILRDATIRAERLVESAQNKVNREQSNLTRIQKEVSDFKNKMLVMYKRHLEAIANMPDCEGEYTAEIPSVTPHMMEANSEPKAVPKEEDLESAFFQATEEETQPNVEEEISATEQNQKQQKASRFGELQFGEEFSLSGTPFGK